jgi:hypothetical protein
MLRLLAELETADGEAMSLYLPAGLPPQDIESLVEKVPPAQAVAPDIVALAAHSPTGAALLWGTSRKFLVLAPFPIDERYIAPAYDVEPLRTLLERDFGIALVLVRSGAYSIGVCQGEKLVSTKTGTGLVHARHRKGGSSQRRFERRREEQMHAFLERVCGHVRLQLEPHATSLDYLVYGGSRTVISSLQKQCRFLQQFESRTLPPLLNIPPPRRKVLESAIVDVWSSTVTEWYDDTFPDIDSQPKGGLT